MTKEEKGETPVDTRTTGTEDGGVDHDGDDGGSKKPKKRKSKKKRSSSTTADAADAAAAEVTAAEAAAGVGDEETTDAEKPPLPPKKKKSKRKSTKSLKESEGVGGGGESSRSLNADGDGDDDDKLERKASIKKKKKKSSRSLTVEDEDDGEGGRRSSRSLTADGDGGGGSSRSLSKKKKKKRTSTTSAASGEDGGEIETGDESKPKSTKKKKKKSKRDITKEEGEEEEGKDGSNKKLMAVATDNIETEDSKKKTTVKESHVEHNIHGNDGGLVLTTSESFQEESELLLKYNDFWCRQSKRVARAPCIHFWVSFVISMILSGIAMTIGEFSVSANNAGWQSRGTLISDRQTQVMLVEFNAQYLFYGGNDAWKDLINNVQPGWEDDDDTVDDRRRRGLELASSPMEIGDYHDELSATSSYWGDMIIPKADRIHPHLTMDPSSPNKESFFLPISMKTAEGKDNNTQIMSTFMSQEEMTRKLQGTSLLQSCDISWYNLPTMTSDHRLWPVWKTKVIPKSKPKTFASAFDSDVLRDLCIAEMNTLMLLEEKELCFGCDDGKTWVSGGLHTGDDPIEHTCLPPYSIVLYARFQVQDHTFKLSCDELATKWESVRDANQEQFLKCVHDIRTIYSPTDPTLPESCPWGFETTMVDEYFGGGEMSDNNKDNKDEDSQTTDEEQVIRYTSSIFPTTSDVLQDLYDNYDDLDTASKSKVVEGAYGTQWEGLIQIHLDASVSRDMSLATGSAFIVALAIVVHTKSLFLTLVGLLQIILSFPLAFFVYKFVAGFDFFPFLNFIGIFVLFALGANDVFVAVDKWKNARLQYPSESVELVAAVAFPDASGAMFQTTLTTAVAFFATALGPVAPIQMFAFFVGLLVLFDYLMNVILVFPALCIYDKSIQNAAVSGRRPNCCITWACCKSGNEEEVAAHHHEHQQHEHELHKKLQQAEDDVEKQDIKKNGEEEEEEEVRPSLIHRILLGYYYLLHRARWGLLVACAVALILSIIFAAQLTLPLSSDVRVLQEDVPFEEAYMWRKKLLYTALDSIRGSRANVIWGVVPADTGTLTDPASWSQLVLDHTFDPSSEESQLYLSKFCDDFFEEDFASPPEANFTCAIQRFDMWLQEQSQSDRPEEGYVDNCNSAASLPVPQEYFHSCISFWSQLVEDMTILSQDGVVRVIYLPFYSRVQFSDPHDVLTEEWHLIEAWMTDKNKAAPSGSKGAYFTSFDFWWYDTNDQMLGTAYSSAGIALCAAAIVVLFASRSIVLTLFSVITIAYVLTSVTATLVSLGWTLGFLESICFAILIGISVDFVIHFGHSYSAVLGDVNRGERTKYALIHMGPSVLAAAFTMMCSAVIMLFTVITFFQKFALILFFTVIQSVAGSFIVFLTLTDCLGPSHPTYVVDSCLAKLQGIRSQGDGKFEKDTTERTATKKSKEGDQSSDSNEGE